MTDSLIFTTGDPWRTLRKVGRFYACKINNERLRIMADGTVCINHINQRDDPDHALERYEFRTKEFADLFCKLVTDFERSAYRHIYIGDNHAKTLL